MKLFFVYKKVLLKTPQDGDLGAIFGIGFRPFTGGPFRYLDQVGSDYVVTELERLKKLHGDRFSPCDLLLMIKEFNTQ